MKTDDCNLERLTRQSLDLTLSVNELRIIVDCLRAVAYLGKIDDEAYLDPDGLDLVERLEFLYRRQLEELGIIPLADRGEPNVELNPYILGSDTEDDADRRRSPFELRSAQS